MYAVSEGMKQINGVVVDTFEREVKRAGTSFEVEAGTTGFCDDARAYVRLKAKDGDFFARVKKDDSDRVNGVEIAVSGNAEVLALLESLEFVFRTLMETCDD